MEKFDSSCYARINGNIVRISTNATQCQYCNQFQWSIKNCSKCMGTKVIKRCKNTMMHTNNNNSGLFFVSYKNQEYCSTTCQFEEDGAFKVAVNFENATIEADIDPKTLTVHELQYSIIEQTTLSRASPPMIIPPRNGLTTTEQLAGDWDIEHNETNVDFIKRSSALLSGDEPISLFFKLPCSELTLNQYIEGVPAAIDINAEYAKYCIITDEQKLKPEELVYSQLSNKVGTYVNQQGRRMLLLRIVPLKSVSKAGKTPMNAESQLMRWFEHVGLEEKVNISILKNRKNMYFKAGKQSLVVGSVNGNAYYDKFLREYAYERTDIISPFVYDRAWILFNFKSEQKRNAWLEHYQKVIDASPPRSFGAVKYLLTTELMKNDKDYHELVNDESDDEEQRWSYYDDMILRYKLLKEHEFKKNDGSVKPPKLPKKKPGKKATNRPTPPPIEVEEEEEKTSSKRLIFRFSREHLQSLKKRPKFSEDSNSWMDTHDPYAEEEEKEEE